MISLRLREVDSTSRLSCRNRQGEAFPKAWFANCSTSFLGLVRHASGSSSSKAEVDVDPPTRVNLRRKLC